MREGKVKVTLFYKSLAANLLKFAFINLIVITVFIEIRLGHFPKIPLFLLSLGLIVDTFIRYSLGNISPSIKTAENNGDKYDSFTKEALESVLFKKNTKDFLVYLNKFSQVKFILQKSVITEKEIFVKEMSLPDLSNKAFEISKNLGGKYVTTGDLITAYLLLNEPETRFLFNKKIKEEDLFNINRWSRTSVPEERPRIRKARFVGVGFGETLTYGWTPETKKYTKDHTFSHIKKRSLIEGRESEYKTLLDTMEKPQNNNVLLVGELGTGKDNLVENFIYESYESKLSKKLNHRRFLEIMVGAFVAGSTSREDLEVRLQDIIAEVKHSGNIVLYIPQFQNLMGSSSYNIDLSGAILPYLKDGKMPIIATMTKGEYKRFFENNALREVFEVIILEEPSFATALKMMFLKTDEIERQNDVNLSFAAVTSAVRYADKYEPNAVLPGTAVDLLNAASNIVKIARGKDATVLEEDVTACVEQKSKIPVGAPTHKEKIVLLNLENEMHKSIIGQEEAVSKVAVALRRVRAGLAREKPISFLFLGPTGVGKTETAKALSRLYFGGEAQIIRLDMSEFGTSDGLPRLIQSGAGSFLDKIETHPFSLVLLDEFEKADPKILNLFLQVLDDGRMTDALGKTVSFNNTIIIATSNAGSEYIRENVANIENRALLDYLQKQGLYTPELLNRFDEVIVFRPLNQEEIASVTRLIVNELSSKLAIQDIVLTVTSDAITKISKDGFNHEFGARPLRRFVQSNIEDVIAKKMLSGEVNRGDTIEVKVDSTGNLVIDKKA
jgi:ATP-dependent Clp protease ATP-binding subunit ClpA